jgi:hypothetical protein
MITKFSTSSISNRIDYDSMLAGNQAFSPGAFEQISTQILGGSVTSVTFSSIPATYKHLQLRYTARSDRASSSDQLGLRFNGDTAANYWYQNLTSNGGGSVQGAGIISSQAQTRLIDGQMAASTAVANLFTNGVVDIVDYVSSAKSKTVRNIFGTTDNTNLVYAAGFMEGLWTTAAAVTSITLFPLNGPNFVSGSRFSLYGIKG